MISLGNGNLTKSACSLHFSVTLLRHITPNNSKSNQPISTVFGMWISVDRKTKTLLLDLLPLPSPTPN